MQSFLPKRVYGSVFHFTDLLDCLEGRASVTGLVFVMDKARPTSLIKIALQW